jgi:hypothetical protein
MEGIPQELLIVGGAALAILAALILVKWGKQILTALLIVAGVAIVGLIGWALIQRPDVIPDDTAETIGDLADIARVVAPKSEPAPAPAPQPAYTAPRAGGGGFWAGALMVLVILALGAGGYFFARWKLAERERGGLRPGPSRRRGTRGQPIIYVIEGPAHRPGEYVMPWEGDCDLVPWGEVDEWTEDEFLPF